MPRTVEPLSIAEIEELLDHDAWAQRNALEDLNVPIRSEYEEWRDELNPPKKSPDRSGWWLVAAGACLVAIAILGFRL